MPEGYHFLQANRGLCHVILVLAVALGADSYLSSGDCCLQNALFGIFLAKNVNKDEGFCWSLFQSHMENAGS